MTDTDQDYRDGVAYQVIGALAERCGLHEDPAVIKALDYFSGGSDDPLPFEITAERTTDAEALAGYRAAVSFISADSWDGCSDCIEILKAARAADWSNDQARDSNATARELARLRQHRPVAGPGTPSE